MSFFGSTGGGAGAQAAAEEALRQQRIQEGTNKINQVFDAGFTPDFYANQAKAYEGFAMPELERQFTRANRDATYQAADRGLLRSGVRDRLGTTLGVEKGIKTREVADTALARANALRGNVEDQRSRQLSQLIASGDPSKATESAIAASSQFKTPQPMGSLGQFFNDWSSIWLDRNNQTKANESFNQGMSAWGTLGNGGSTYNVE